MQLIEQVIPSEFQQFPKQSKLWVYQANEPLSSSTANELAQDVKQFAANWQVHGTPAKASAAVLHNRFLVFVVNEHTPASGCSIDASVQFVHQLETKYALNFFDRMQICYQLPKTDTIKSLPLSKFKASRKAGEIPNESFIFNNTVTSLEEFAAKWKQPVQESWLA